MLTFATYQRHVSAQGYSPATRRLLLGVVADCARQAEVDPLELRSAHVEDYLTRQLAQATRRHYLYALRNFGTWMGQPELTSTVRRPRSPQGVPRPVGEDDLAAMLGVAEGQGRAFVVLGAYCGLRSFETAKVAGRDFQRGRDGLQLRVQGKGGRVDLLPLSKGVQRELRDFRRAAGDAPLWPGVTPNAVQRAVADLGQRVGVRVTSHQLRHRYGTALYAESRDLLVVQRLMRHSSPSTTAGYALVADEVGARLVDRLPGL